VAGRDTPAIIPDDVGGARTAVTALLSAGHDEGIYLVGETPAEKLPTHSRRIGIEGAMADAGVHLAGILPCMWWPEPAYDAVTQLLASGKRPRALICLNDRIAFGAYQALTAADLTIPDDVSVISFDDSPLATWLRPKLTSVAMPYLEMGKLAVETLLEEPHARGLIHVPMLLRERGSIGPPPRSGRRRPTGGPASQRRRTTNEPQRSGEHRDHEVGSNPRAAGSGQT
jgi:LacI family transcriptional regulator